VRSEEEGVRQARKKDAAGGRPRYWHFLLRESAINITQPAALYTHWHKVKCAFATPNDSFDAKAHILDDPLKK